jgi:hypothetical protein
VHIWGAAVKNLLIFLVVVAAGGYLGAKWYLHREVGRTVDTAVLMLSPYAEVDYEAVDSTLTGELAVEGVRVRLDGFGDTIVIDRLGIDTPSFLSLIRLTDLAAQQPDAMPEYFGVVLEGLHIPAGADYYTKLYQLALEGRGVTEAEDAAVECTGRYGFSPRALDELGYREQAISASVTVRNQEGRYTFDVGMNLQEMWDLTASITLDGDLMTEVSRGKGYRPRLSGMRVEMTDRSLNRRVAEYCVRRGLSADQAVDARVESFRVMGRQYGIEFDDYVLGPYRDYIGGKSTLVVTARPNKPVAFSQIDLYKPSDVPALLNLEATAL